MDTRSAHIRSVLLKRLRAILSLQHMQDDQVCSQNLKELGLDSLRMVEFLLEAESELGFTLNEDELDIEAIASIDSLVPIFASSNSSY